MRHDSRWVALAPHRTGCAGWDGVLVVVVLRSRRPPAPERSGLALEPLVAGWTAWPVAVALRLRAPTRRCDVEDHPSGPQGVSTRALPPPPRRTAR